MKRIGFPLVLILIVGAMVAVFAVGNKPKPIPKPDPSVVLDEKQFPNQGQKHLTKSDEEHEVYNSAPPSSGSHNPKPAPWGIQDAELPDETLVHNLEHGGIEIAYRPDLDPAEITKLKDLVNQLPMSQQFNEVKAVLVPRAHNEHPVSVVGWTYVMNLESVDGAKIRQFYLNHLDKGPELVP